MGNMGENTIDFEVVIYNNKKMARKFPRH